MRMTHFALLEDRASKLVSAILKDKCDFLCHNFEFTSYKSELF